MTQLRGEDLKVAIKKGILDLYKTHGKKYIYNATELSDFIGVSRVTLNKYREFIDNILNQKRLERRKTNNEGLIADLNDKINKLEEEKVELIRELDAMRKHHTEIYSTIYMNSYDAAVLIKAKLQPRDAKKCYLCGGDIKHKIKSNVVPIND